MAVPHDNGYNSFRQTGWPAVCLTKYVDAPGGNDVITSPGAGKSIHLLGIMCKNQTVVANNLGTIMDIPGEGDGWRFPGAVAVGVDHPVKVTSGDEVTLFYYIHDYETD